MAAALLHAARTLRAAALACRAEPSCRPAAPPAAPPPASPAAQPPALPGTRTDAPPACIRLSTGPEGALTRLQKQVESLEAENARCADFVCPSVDCAARRARLAAAAFSAAMLEALGGPAARQPPLAARLRRAAKPGADAPPPADAADPETLGRAFARLARGFDAHGHDPEALRAAAAAIARMEPGLAGDADAGEPAAPRGHWRMLAARLALASVRDALTRVQLAEDAQAVPARLPGLARRIANAVHAINRLARVPAMPRTAEVCDGQVRPVLALTARFARALEDAGACTVRAGCDAHAAVAEGRARARLLLTRPALSPALEVVRALEEEAGAGAADDPSGAGIVGEAPAPRIALAHETFTAGEAIAVEVDRRGNRCLADGGHVALFSTGAPGAAPLERIALDTPALLPGRAGGAGRDTVTLWFEAPGPGRFELAVHAAQGSGGVRLSRRPLQVVAGPPPRCTGWTGVWQTEFGRLVTVAHADGTVSGTYRRSSGTRPGFLVGRIEKDALTGVWFSEIGRGGTRLRLIGDGVFRGSWGLSPRRVSGGGVWTGICMADPASGFTAPADAPAGP